MTHRHTNPINAQYRLLDGVQERLAVYNPRTGLDTRTIPTAVGEEMVAQQRAVTAPGNLTGHGDALDSAMAEGQHAALLASASGSSSAVDIAPAAMRANNALLMTGRDAGAQAAAAAAAPPVQMPTMVPAHAPEAQATFVQQDNFPGISDRQVDPSRTSVGNSTVKAMPNHAVVQATPVQKLDSFVTQMAPARGEIRESVMAA